MAQEAKRVGNEKRKVLETYVREHPDSELPEAQEIRQEIIKNEKNAIADTMGYRALGGVLINGVGNFENRIGITERDLKNPEWLRGQLTRFLLASTGQSEDLEKLVKTVAEETAGDSLSVQATAEALKEMIFGYQIQEDGTAKMRDGVWYDTTGRDGWSKPINTVGKIYEASTGNEIEDLKNSHSAGPLLASVLDQTELEKFSQRIIELGQVNKALEALPQQKKALEGKVTELNQLSQEQENQDRKIQSYKRSITDKQKAIQDLEQNIARLPFVALDEKYAQSAISYSRESGWGDKKLIRIAAFRERADEISAKIQERKKVLEALRDETRQKYDEAKNAKRGLFNKKALKEAEEAARGEWRKADDMAEEPSKHDAEFQELNQAWKNIDKKYEEVSVKVRDALSWLTTYDNIDGTNLQDFLAKVREQGGEPLLQKMQDEKGKVEDELEGLREENKALAEKVETLREELLKETGYRSPDFRRVSEALQSKAQRLQEDAVSLRRQLSGS